MTSAHHIVFLDRDSLIAELRRPAFAHRWQEYPAGAAADTVPRLRDASIAISNKVALREADLARLPRLKMIAVAATGTDMIDLEACRARGIVVSNIRGYATSTLPEHCFALILALRRNVLAYRADIEAGRWQRSTRFCLLDHPIRDLAGSQLGLIGYGALGQAVAELGRAFGMRVAVHSRTPAADPRVENMTLDRLLASSDVISLHLPLSAATRHLISAAQLARMKPDALLINTARGGLVDEAALAAALEQGVIGGAGFDVLSAEPPPAEHVLLRLRRPNFILTPHVAWASAQAMQILADQLIDNVEAFAAGRPANVVT